MASCSLQDPVKPKDFHVTKKENIIEEQELNIFFFIAFVPFFLKMK